jgi:hypothetical protein
MQGDCFIIGAFESYDSDDEASKYGSLNSSSLEAILSSRVDIFYRNKKYEFASALKSFLDDLRHLHLNVGQLVKLHSLVKSSWLNDSFGIVSGGLTAAGRYPVKLFQTGTDVEGQDPVAIRRENLIPSEQPCHLMSLQLESLNLSTPPTVPSPNSALKPSRVVANRKVFSSSKLVSCIYLRHSNEILQGGTCASKEILFPSYHPALTDVWARDGHIAFNAEPACELFGSAVTKAIGIPLQLFVTGGLSIGASETACRPAVTLMIELSSSFAPTSWQLQVPGDIVVCRSDKTDLHLAQVSGHSIPQNWVPPRALCSHD